MTKDSTALSNSLSLVHEAKLIADRYPSEADDVGGIRRASIHILQRSLNNLVSKNQEISAALAAFCLLGMPSTMHARKFWYVFIRPAVAMQKQHFAAEMTHDNGDDGADESDENADEVGGSSDEKDDGDEVEAEQRVISEREDYVLDLSGDDSRFDQPDVDGLAEVIQHSEGGDPVIVQQHEHYQHRGDGLREMNFDEYCVLVKITRVPKKRAEPALAAAADAPEAKEDGDDGDDGGGDDESDDEEEPLSARGVLPRRRQGARTRNAVFDFTPDHKLYLSHEQRLRSDPHIGILGGHSPPPFPGPRVGDGTPSWHRAAQLFAEYMITLLCSWNPITFHPERFDRARCEWVQVPLNWTGLCQWVEDLHDRESALRAAADAESVRIGTPQVC